VDKPLSEPAIVATSAALEAIAGWWPTTDPSCPSVGGCCDGSLPICFRLDEFIVGEQDVLLGQVGALLSMSTVVSTSWGIRNSFSMSRRDCRKDFRSPRTDHHFITRSQMCSVTWSRQVGHPAVKLAKNYARERRKTWISV